MLDTCVFKFSQWSGEHLTFFKSMLKPGGTFTFPPEMGGLGDELGVETISQETQNLFYNCQSLDELYRLIEALNPKAMDRSSPYLDFSVPFAMSQLGLSAEPAIPIWQNMIQNKAPVIQTLMDTQQYKNRIQQFIEWEFEIDESITSSILSDLIHASFKESFTLPKKLPFLKTIFPTVNMDTSNNANSGNV